MVRTCNFSDYLIDAEDATEICDKLVLKVTIPMHFRNDRRDLPISGADDFLQGKVGVSRVGTSEREFKSGELSATTKIIGL